MLRVKGAVQHYDWGRVGKDSYVAKLYCLSSGDEVQEDKPYGELWMGTHPSAPSLLLVDDGHGDGGEKGKGGAGGKILLNEWLQEHPEALGDAVLKKWAGDLPFLFKVLSVAKALSIQAHPDKRLAEQLHEAHPKVYKDPNHKPEMALAVSDFEALCGFVSSEDLKHVLQSVPELRNVLHETDVQELLNVAVVAADEQTTTVTIAPTPPEAGCEALRRAFTTLMTLEKDKVTETVRALTARLRDERDVRGRTLSSREELILVLEGQYPDDVGVLASLFLNYIRLKPGEAVYLAANVPHAYISGECVECMATSDNVVRAGLTPKFRDTATLSSMLTYEQGVPHLLQGHPVSRCTKRYSPPFDEFEVDMITVPHGDSLQFSAIPGPSIFLVSDGSGTVVFEEGKGGEGKKGGPSLVKKGDVFFLPAGKEFRILAEGGEEKVANGNGHGYENGNGRKANGISSGKSPVRLYRAGVNSTVL